MKHRCVEVVHPKVCFSPVLLSKLKASFAQMAWSDLTKHTCAVSGAAQTSEQQKSG